MGWPVKQDCIDDIVSNYEASRVKCNLAWQELDDAERFNNMSLFKTAIEHLIEAVNYNLYATYYILVRNTAYTPNYAVPYFFINHTDGVLTWKAICEAWIKNDFEGRAPTIAIIDRMRQILWDEPFSITWAARPESKIE